MEATVVRGSQDVDAVIHRCLLNEVFLLIDFVSGRSDRTLDGLDGIIDPAAPARAMTATEALGVLNHIRYPPHDGVQDRARDATVLMQAKDRLNGLACPASGLSVAYTTMFAGGAQTGAGWRARLAGVARRRGWPAWMADESNDGATRATLAVNAYPSLALSAQRFRLAVVLLMVGALVVTLFSVWVSYEVALGRSLLLRFDALDRQQAELTTRIYAAEQGLAPAGPARAGAVPRLCAAEPVSVQQQELCDSYADWQRKNALAFRDLQDYARQPGVRALTPRMRLERDGPAADPPQPGTAGQDPAAQGPVEQGQSEQLAASVLGAFSTSMLPVQFALLGTAAAVVRGIYSHVRRRTLTPRQLNLALIRLPLGLVAGVSVGLLFSPDTAAVQGGSLGAGGSGGGLASELSLSASAVAFLAGYGVDAVFSLFDALLKRLFVPEDMPAGPAAPARL